jgi:hypothetical protein
MPQMLVFPELNQAFQQSFCDFLQLKGTSLVYQHQIL